MRNFFAFVVLASSLLVILSSCNSQQQENLQEQSTIRVAALRGPTALGLLQLMSESEQNNTRNNYTFELLGSPEQIPPLITRGEVDIAAIPGNLASILYNNLDGDVQALAVVTLGVLHVVDTTGEINSVTDLAGRTIFAGGQGATPEFALNYILSQNGLTPGVDVIVEFRAEHTEIAAMLETGLAEIAMLPEPFASTVLSRVNGLRHALDLTEEWNKIQSEYGLIMSVVIGRRNFLEENPEAVAILMEEYAASIEYMTANLAEAAQLAAYYEIIPNAAIAAQAIPRTHITFLYGETMKRNLLGFFNVLYRAEPRSIGGRIPDEKFFFIP